VAILALASLALAVGSVLFLVVLVVRRLLLARGERRREEVRSQYRPVALAIVHGESVPLRDLVRTHGQAALFAELLAGYSRNLTGTARERIAEFFEQRGDVARELVRLGARSKWTRAAAAALLGDMASPAAIPALLRTLGHDESRPARAAAARSLGLLRAAEAVPALLEALALGRVPRAIAAQALLDVGADAAPALRSLLEHGRAEVRAWASELLGLVGAPSDAERLTARLVDTSGEVRERAAHALGRLGAGEAAEALRAALADRLPYVRAAAATALGQLRDPQAAAALLVQARDDAFDPARAAARALSRIDGDLVLAESELPAAGPHLREAADLLRL
jgi:HEAT repeat protein